MRKVKLLLLDKPDQDWSEGTEVEFLVEDMTPHEEEIFFHNLRSLVRPNVRVFNARAVGSVNFLRHKYQEVGVDPKQSSLS